MALCGTYFALVAAVPAAGHRLLKVYGARLAMTIAASAWAWHLTGTLGWGLLTAVSLLALQSVLTARVPATLADVVPGPWRTAALAGRLALHLRNPSGPGLDHAAAGFRKPGWPVVVGSARQRSHRHDHCNESRGSRGVGTAGSPGRGYHRRRPAGAVAGSQRPGGGNVLLGCAVGTCALGVAAVLDPVGADSGHVGRSGSDRLH